MSDIVVRTLDGRLVALSADRWRHIVDGHPELAEHRELVLSAVEGPSAARTGRRPDETWFYGHGGPSRFLKVVVHWTSDRGEIVTAFARRRLP